MNSSTGDSDGGLVQLPPMYVKSEKSTCTICCEEGDGYHFGAEACRACAAFFRRSVSLGKKYVCRADGKCQITANIRCMCRACRFSRCLEVGMNPAGVQQRRDTIGKRETPKTPPLLPIKVEPLPIGHSPLLSSTSSSFSLREEPSSSSPLQINFKPSEETMPILERMRQNYAKMDNGRSIIHRREGESLFGQRIPRSVNYKEAATVSSKEIALVVDWVSWCFDDFQQLSSEQKKVLFRNFFMAFTMLESSYLCHINNREDVIILPSGDYIDLNNLETFYHETGVKLDSVQKVSAEDAAKIFKQSFESYRNASIRPMIREKVDVYEFFTLCTCLFWDFGLDGQDEQSIEIGRIVKEKVFKELSLYLRFVKKSEDPSVRIGSLVTLLPGIQRSVRRIQEDIEISNVFNIYAPSEEFYNIINGKFI
ncbi:unnamed protein product [Caenorhabditis angaria]|uniref:Uncharacterized protein n=1 Tax=Caenorhabditis angaria TaxID=860376 RepID=A0A9P1IY58_9PELO|nr:unnamed protein product [Caenorhabditis angaria]